MEPHNAWIKSLILFNSEYHALLIGESIGGWVLKIRKVVVVANIYICIHTCENMYI